LKRTGGNGGNGQQVQRRINACNNLIAILGTTAGPGNLGCQDAAKHTKYMAGN